MAEARDDLHAAHFVHKVAHHLGNSGLQEVLTDFLELHFEELRLELRCGDSRPSPEQKEGLGQEENGQKNDAEWWEKRRAEQESDDGDLDEKRRQGKAAFEDGEFSQRVHELYRDFLRVVTANLEEFVKAEGLTQVQFRDACDREIQAKVPGGISFMYALISWEFSSFIALVSGFLDERAESGEDEEESEAGGGEDDDGEDEKSSASPSSPSSEPQQIRPFSRIGTGLQRTGNAKGDN